MCLRAETSDLWNCFIVPTAETVKNATETILIVLRMNSGMNLRSEDTGCRFEVYNGSLLNYNVDKNFGEVVNLVGLNKEVKEKIINNIPVVGIKTFSGNLIRGVY